MHRGILTDFAFLKRMQTFNTTHVILEKGVDILSSLKELLLESCIKIDYLSCVTCLLSHTIRKVWTYYCLVFEIK